MVELFHNIEVATFEKEGDTYLLNYKNLDIQNSITLSLPNSQKIYTWQRDFPSYFESFLPEGYLFEIFKNLLIKEYGYIDDYLLFSILASNIDGRIKFKTEHNKLDFMQVDIDEILNNDTQDTFNKLLNSFLNKNAISGVQPKTLALVRDKESLVFKEYIVKTWGDEYPYLAENEYHCLMAVQRAGVEIPNIKLSKNKRFLLVEKFIYEKDKVYGFEEVLSLSGKNRVQKYSGSYEQVAKIIAGFCTNKKSSLIAYYKTVVMNYLLKNGDAHLKNFGLLFDDDFRNIWFAPTYDVVTTTAYIYKDKPALTLDGKKLWFAKDTLVQFGQKHCMLSKKEALQHYKTCLSALVESIGELEKYIVNNTHFEQVGQRMLESWKLSLDEKTIKEIDNDTIRSWQND